MRSRQARHVTVLGVALAGAVIAAACGSSGDDGAQTGGGSGNDSGANPPGTGPFTNGEGGGGTPLVVDSLTVDPGTALLDISAAPFPTEKFKATAHYADGTQAEVSPAWSASNTAVGTIAADGTYAPRGTQGGVVTVTATLQGKTADAKLTVRLHQVDNPAGADAATVAGLLGATAADASVVWTYPYDGTAFPRGLNAPQLMWNNGADGDVYAVHVTSPTFELQVFTNATNATAIAGATPAGARSFAFGAAAWAAFVDSTSGAAHLNVSRKSGSTFTKIADEDWTIASRSMSGTIYYWAINKGQVLRIKPGATAPDAFLGAPPAVPPVGTPSLVCPSCHTVSADGSRLFMSTGRWDGCDTNTVDVWSTIWDLTKAAPQYNGYETHAPPSELPLTGVTPDGKVAVENWAQVRSCGSPGAQSDAALDATGTSGALAPIAG